MNIVSTIIVVAVLLAWLVPLVIGLKLMRGEQRKRGTILALIGIIWAIPSVMGLVLGVMHYSGARSNFETKDFDPAKYRGATGIVRSSYQGPGKLVLRPQTGPRSAQATRYLSQNGSFIVPLGHYRSDDFTVTAQDAKGKSWEAVSSLMAAEPIEVTKETPAALKVGPPYQAKIVVHQFTGSESLGLELTDSANNAVKLTEAGVNPPPPTFVVLDKAGHKLFNGKFAFG